MVSPSSSSSSHPSSSFSRRQTSSSEALFSPNATTRLMTAGRPDTPRNETQDGSSDADLEAHPNHHPTHEAHTPTYHQLSNRTKTAYGVGHFMNDLTASFWFSYLLVFLRSVLRFSGTAGGLLLLIGQISDGVATPIAGYLSDKTTRARAEYLLMTSGNVAQNGGKHKYSSEGRSRGAGRKVWIAAGSVVLGVSYPLVFHSELIHISHHSVYLRVLYYSIPICLLQVAWACVQVSHLAMVPELTPNQGERVYLNSLRSCFTILSGFAVYSACYLCLDSSSTTSSKAGDSGLSPSDEMTFFRLSLGIVAVGAVFVTLFLLNVEEPPPRIKPAHHKSIDWYDWLKQWKFYLTCVIYACTRIQVNVGQVFVSLWLLNSVEAPKSTIASIPLIVFAVGFVSTLLSERLTKLVGSAGLTFLGCSSFMAAGTLVFYCRTYTVMTYLTAVFLGIGTGVVGVSALSLICELVGINTESSAFVFGAMSLADKFSSGAAIFLIEWYGQVIEEHNPRHVSDYYRYVMTLVPAGSSAICITGLVLLKGWQLIKRSTDYEPIR